MTDSVRDEAEQAEVGALSGLEFEVSRVVQRLEASVSGAASGANAAGDEADSDRGRRTSHEFLEPHETSIDEILRSVERLVVSERGDEQDACAALPPAGRLTRAAVLAHSVAAYCGVLERMHLARLHSAVAVDTQRWLTHLFHLADYNAYFHYEPLDGLVRITRMLLHHKYPRYLEQGALALTSKLPCIYSSVASPLGVVQHLCRQLGLPLACIRPVAVDTRTGGQTLDAEVLERLVREDAASADRTPLLVLGEAGGSALGHADPAARLQGLCREHGAWLHLRGHGLASLALPPPTLTTERIADSLTLTPGTWFGIPGLPVVTLYRLPELQGSEHTRPDALPLLGGLAGGADGARGARLPALPLWCVLRAAGRECLMRHLQGAFAACVTLHDMLRGMPSVRILSKRPGGEIGVTVEELMSKQMDASVVLEAAVPCVAFQFAPAAPDGAPLPPRLPPYFDKLNSWLGQILQREADQMPIDIVDTEAFGLVLRYCPLECAVEAGADGGLCGERLATIADCLRQQLDILTATVALKDTFAELVGASAVLRPVEVAGWAGLGGVRYVPLGWETLPQEQVQGELNALNRALVEALKSTDSAFSCGEGADGMACVRFGMVTNETDVEELLVLVVQVGHEVEEQGKVLDTMTEIVKKGIETATEALQREQEERLWQEGLLRRVPVVGRVVDWWSPPPNTGLRGRCLHLAHGTVESTENIYKYHMQIAAGTVPHGVTRAPPPAELQTAVGPPLPPLAAAAPPQHSRSSSAHSQTTA